MKYNIHYGVSVRAYADTTIETPKRVDMATLKNLAIEHFKENSDSLKLSGYDPDNLAHPSIVDIFPEGETQALIQNEDFAISEEDNLDYAAPKMLEALKFVRMTLADIEASKRKGYIGQCIKLVSEAISKAEGK